MSAERCSTSHAYDFAISLPFQIPILFSMPQVSSLHHPYTFVMDPSHTPLMGPQDTVASFNDVLEVQASS